MNLEDHFYHPEILPIDMNVGLGYEFLIDGVEIITAGEFDKKGEFRIARVNIKTYGVEHCYCNINIHVDNSEKANPDRCHFGYLGGVVVPKEYRSFTIDLLRLVTQEEIDKYPCRWKGYEVGDKTNAFYSVGEIISLLMDVKDLIFKGKWILEVDSFSGKYNREIVIDN